MGGGGKSAHDLLKDDKLSSEVGMEPAAKRRRKESEDSKEEDDVIEHASVPQDQEVDLGSIKDKLSKKKDNKSKNKAKQGANSIEKYGSKTGLRFCFD